jgi:glutamate-1-semialdehyde 2,1-aminomutase
MLREETLKAGALLIFDEVMTSRFKGGGAQALWGITPDITALGKYLGGGMTFGAFGGRAEIMSIYDPRRKDAIPHAGTFNNNVVTMAAGIAGLSKLFTPERAVQLHDFGENTIARLNDVLRQVDARLIVTGVGSLMMFHDCGSGPVGAGSLRTEDARVKQLLYFDLLEQGYFIGPRNFLALSLEVSEPMIDGLVEALRNITGARRSVYCR